LKDCKVIQGDLFVTGGVYSLSPLKKLKHVQGSFSLTNLYGVFDNAVVDLLALSNLQRVDGCFTIEKNPRLEGLTGLENLVFADGLHISYNPRLLVLTSFSLSKLGSEGLSIIKNGQLLNIQFFYKLLEVEGSLILSHLPKVSSIDAIFPLLKKIQGDFVVDDLPLLQALSKASLPHLRRVLGDVNLHDNGQLSNVEVLNNLIPFTSNFLSFKNLPRLCTFDGQPVSLNAFRSVVTIPHIFLKNVGTNCSNASSSASAIASLSASSGVLSSSASLLSVSSSVISTSMVMPSSSSVPASSSAAPTFVPSMGGNSDIFSELIGTLLFHVGSASTTYNISILLQDATLTLAPVDNTTSLPSWFSFNQIGNNTIFSGSPSFIESLSFTTQILNLTAIEAGGNSSWQTLAIGIVLDITGPEYLALERLVIELNTSFSFFSQPNRSEVLQELTVLGFNLSQVSLYDIRSGSVILDIGLNNLSNSQAQNLTLIATVANISNALPDWDVLNVSLVSPSKNSAPGGNNNTTSGSSVAVIAGPVAAGGAFILLLTGGLVVARRQNATGTLRPVAPLIATSERIPSPFTSPRHSLTTPNTSTPAGAGSPSQQLVTTV
jgi:hypothetical protein